MTRFSPIVWLVTGLLTGAVSGPALGQSPATPRTAWGDPDLQGLWTNPTITPFERPPSMEGRATLTTEEVAAVEVQTAARRAAGDANPRPGVVGAYNQFWLDSGTKVLETGQTSLVVDPADGRVPTRQEAEAVRDHNLAHAGDSYTYMSVWDRCISRGVPGSMLPAGYNNAYRFVQLPDYLVIVYEMIHDIRVIPIADRPHVSDKIRLWMGDSRARWDGDTLVIETTNYNSRGWIASSAAGARIKGIPVSEQLHVVERFTRVDDDTLSFEVTIRDPEVFTGPWTISMPMTLDPDYELYEYACHEGNGAVGNALSGARAVEPVP